MIRQVLWKKLDYEQGKRFIGHKEDVRSCRQESFLGLLENQICHRNVRSQSENPLNERKNRSLVL